MTKQELKEGKYNSFAYANEFFGGAQWKGRQAINEYGAGMRSSIPAPEVEGMTHEEVESWLMDNYYIAAAGMNLYLIKILDKLADRVVALEQ